MVIAIEANQMPNTHRRSLWLNSTENPVASGLNNTATIAKCGGPMQFASQLNPTATRFADRVGRQAVASA
jgi:hypothetical protein